MTLPNELVDHIFEYVYTSLCHHAAQRELDFPIGSKLVFSNFSLVSKTWHSLSLPFLVRHFDGKNVEAFTRFVENYQLLKSIKSIYLNPNFKGWPNPETYWNSVDVYSDDGIDENEYRKCECGRAAEERYEEDLEAEISQWTTLLKKSFPTLESLEIGSRRRDKEEVGPHYGKWHFEDDEDHDWGEGGLDTAPVNDLQRLFDAFSTTSQLSSLRLNLPDEMDNRYEKAEAQQLAATISSRFPNLQHYTLHSHSTANLEQPKKAISFPPLQSLKMVNIVCNDLGLTENLYSTYLLPSSPTLRYLELQVKYAEVSSIKVQELFGDLKFPLLEELHLDSADLSCTQSDFFDRFPRIRSASIPLHPEETSLDTLPLLPSSLRQLTLSYLDDSSLLHLAQYLHREDLSHLTHLVLEGLFDMPGEAPAPEFPDFETSETPTTELATIIRICARNQVELCYSMALPEEGIDVDSLEELSEDEDWDFDAEDGDKFRSLWSIDKTRSHDIDEAFSRMRYWLKTNEAEEKAKEAIKPFLLR